MKAHVFAVARHMLPALIAVSAASASLAQNTGAERISVKAGTTAVVTTVGCAKDVTPPSAAKVVTWPTGSAIVLTSQPGQRDDVVFSANVGKANANGTDCDPPLVNHQYIVSFNAAPEVSGQALQTSFQVLVAALVLALLLESAFALLFNWRPFNILVVGRAWRSPIMLVAAWFVVTQFNFDLMAQLFNAYYAQVTQPTSTWGTSLLTAMILAGGSVGVNRILTTLGFRSPVREGEEPPKTDETHAWVAVEVEPADKNQRFMVAITEATPPAGTVVETAVGIAGNPRPSLKSIFTGDIRRVPTSGGLQVLASKFYTITVRDLDTSKDYDVTGKELVGNVSATIFRFAPRAVLDFRVKMPK